MNIDYESPYFYITDDEGYLPFALTLKELEEISFLVNSTLLDYNNNPSLYRGLAYEPLSDERGANG